MLGGKGSSLSLVVFELVLLVGAGAVCFAPGPLFGFPASMMLFELADEVETVAAFAALILGVGA